ncbi:two-component system sensor histidine kinase NtrB [Pulveribacter suum]|uniref:histidine kinase n=1 Tax=Pulveribacter suum TaxID=2116657 RepID=A0A2P1NI38_9BURK|nr:ATP-binding protein [Pulveribacter suum]AVP56716.1 PAS domain-containing sensor histidine kinase [Pulveribacter suum]
MSAAARAGRRPVPRWARLPRRWLSAWRRWSLWVLLGALVAGVLVTLVWLAGRYEASQVQERLERDAIDAATDLRRALARNLQDMLALPDVAGGALAWQGQANELLSRRPELTRLEWRDEQLDTRAQAGAPRQGGAPPGDAAHSGTAMACANARRLMAPSYSSSYYQLLPGGTGAELMEVCAPLIEAGRVRGYLVGTYALQVLLADVVGPQLQRTQGVSFTEADGTRLALVRAQRRGSRVFTAQQLFDLPGNTLVLRMDGWHAAPSVFPNVLTALVTAMSIALVSVLVVLVRDTRRRLRAERDLAEALAFRKAMEDSLVTGLRARDLHGRITYVNPAFCAMVGFAAAEIVGRAAPLPYWPPELAEEYTGRQARRLAGRLGPSSAGYETVFVRRDGSHFPVMVYEAPLINAHGVHTGWMGCILDVGEQRRAEELSRTTHERLQATARLATVGEMASLLSHELNQPLAAIASYATGSLNLLAPLPGDVPDAQDLEQVRGAVQRIAHQAERAGRVIKSVHDFVRRRPHTRESVPAQDLLEAVLPIIRLQARKLAVQVVVEIAPGLPPALCDRTMVEQVLLNLTRNAMQAMDGQEGEAARLLQLQVRPAPEGGPWLEFAVADNGSGIPEDVAARLFTPFYTTRIEGMGLGLSLCRTVAEQHGGRLAWLARQPRGTVFVFTLPADTQPGASR